MSNPCISLASERVVQDAQDSLLVFFLLLVQGYDAHHRLQKIYMGEAAQIIEVLAVDVKKEASCCQKLGYKTLSHLQQGGNPNDNTMK